MVYEIQTLEKLSQKKVGSCLIFRQIFFLLSITLLVNSNSSYALAPDDDMSPVPAVHNLWLNNVFVPDDAGVMNSIKETYDSWAQTEEYVDNWNLESTKLYKVPTPEEKKAYSSKIFLKYADKRLSGEVKRSKEGSTMYAIGQAQKALRPQAEVRMAPQVKVKFRGRFLEGKGMIHVYNPIMDYQTTINYKGDVQMTASKEIKPVGIFASLNYEVTNDSWVAAFDRKLTEKWSTRLSSSQNDETMAFTRVADTRLELFFNHYF
jgi:hypothetical protein